MSLASDLTSPSYWSPLKISTSLLWRCLDEAAPKHARGRLIDIGCGAKPYEALFSPHVESYYGVDFAPTSDACYGSETKADLYADCTDTKLPAASFDTVLSTQVLEHVLETDKFIAECHRLLVKGGKGIITVPFVWESHAEPFDFYRFTRFSLEQLFQRKGFRVVELKPVGGAYAALTQLKIISIYTRGLPNTLSYLPYRIARKLRNLVMLPIWNWTAINLDGLFWNDKLCLNYLLVVEKE